MNMASFRDELVQILVKRAADPKAKVTEKLIELAKRRPVATLGVAAGTGAGVHHVGGTAIKDWETGRTYRKQMERSR